MLPTRASCEPWCVRHQANNRRRGVRTTRVHAVRKILHRAVPSSTSDRCPPAPADRLDHNSMTIHVELKGGRQEHHSSYQRGEVVETSALLHAHEADMHVIINLYMSFLKKVNAARRKLWFAV
jgi:hypothetical protein